MYKNHRIAVIIPALDEEASLGSVLSDIPAWVDETIVIDNGSRDATAEVARKGGARVLACRRRGYGSACLTGLAAAFANPAPPEIIVFIDADYSDRPGEMERLVKPIAKDEVDLVIGSRVLGKAEPGSLTPQQRWGNWLACRLMRLFWGVRFTDLGPFRATRASAYESLGMCDPDFGWTVEMQIKAARARLRAIEVPVSYHCRIGVSKISGTLRGVWLAGKKILGTIFRAAWHERIQKRRPPTTERLIVFSRYPTPGKTKTRLIPELGPAGAANLQRELTEHTLQWCRELQKEAGTEILLHYCGASRGQFKRWLGDDIRFKPQQGCGLGERLLHAFGNAFDEGARRVLAVGIDCPGLTSALSRQALDALESHDVVLGPATDGGYYLIGLRRPVPALFAGIDWGSEKVFEQTEAIAQQLQLRIAKLDPLGDIDEPDDLELWESTKSNRQTS